MKKALLTVDNKFENIFINDLREKRESVCLTKEQAQSLGTALLEMSETEQIGKKLIKFAKSNRKYGKDKMTFDKFDF